MLKKSVILYQTLLIHISKLKGQKVIVRNNIKLSIQPLQRRCVRHLLTKIWYAKIIGITPSESAKMKEQSANLMLKKGFTVNSTH